MLYTLLKYRFYVKLLKYVFNRNEIIFLKFIINQHDIEIKLLYIEIIIK